MRCAILALVAVLVACSQPASPAEYRDLRLCDEVQSDADALSEVSSLNTEFDQANRIADACIWRQAVLLAQSSDAADQVASAIVYECSYAATRSAAAWNQLQAREQDLFETKREIENEMQRRAVNNVVKARAGRCWLPEPPLARAPS